MNRAQKVKDLIEQLTGDFSVDAEKFRNEIVPEMYGLDEGDFKYFVSMICNKCQVSAQVIIQVIKEVWTEIRENQSSNGCCLSDPEILEAAMQYAKDPQIFRKMIDVTNELGITGNRKAIGLIHVTIASRLNPQGSETETIAAKCGGTQGAGKSTLVGKCLRLNVEGETYIRMTDATEKSLYHLGDILKNKCLFLEEGENLKKDNGFAYVIRSLISEGQLKKVISKNDDSKWFPTEIVVEGPISFITTSVHAKLEKQFEDRVFVIRPDVSSELTNKILYTKFLSASGKKKVFDSRIISAWKAYNLSLEPFEVVIPYADKIFKTGYYLPTSANRAYSRFISAIKTVTLLHQKQRHVGRDGRLVAEMADYAIARQLFQDCLLESIDLHCLVNDQKYQIIREEGVITPGELSKRLGITTSAVSNWIKRETQNGLLIWCDQQGEPFENLVLLSNAKAKGEAFLKLADIPDLPSPYELTGEASWDKGGRLHEIYNLHLDRDDAYIDPLDPEPLGVRLFKREDVNPDIILEPEVYDLEIIPGTEDYLGQVQ